MGVYSLLLPYYIEPMARQLNAHPCEVPIECYYHLMKSKEQSDPFGDIKDPKVLIEHDCEYVRIKPKGFYPNGPRVEVFRVSEQPQAVGFDIKTILPSGSRHAYFEEHRATELVARAISYLEQFKPIETTRFFWRAPTRDAPRSDNFERYVEVRNRLSGEMSLEEAKIKAALATWSIQHIALPNGFANIEHVDEAVNSASELRNVRVLIGR